MKEAKTLCGARTFVLACDCQGCLLALTEYRDGTDPEGRLFRPSFEVCEMCGDQRVRHEVLESAEAARLIEGSTPACVYEGTIAELRAILKQERRYALKEAMTALLEELEQELRLGRRCVRLA